MAIHIHHGNRLNGREKDDRQKEAPDTPNHRTDTENAKLYNEKKGKQGRMFRIEAPSLFMVDMARKIDPSVAKPLRLHKHKCETVGAELTMP
jgi:hypothetical protein